MVTSKRNAAVWPEVTGCEQWVWERGGADMMGVGGGLLCETHSDKEGAVRLCMCWWEGQGGAYTSGQHLDRGE